ncbi:gastrin-releasing peptide [Salmo salar]|uniref:Gastrin-releasing peptide n=1 Tax=Salmo salar TaxID=8030 RepID=A0A1S3LUW4_SALSA|nr:gastrin-releasing peptide [Salmo salar]|eukprot:XP_013994369.1 PREDICTED: gastrin-releasing peptide isoform X1 [Salmo salar]
MGDLCHAWTYKPSLSIAIILVSIASMAHCSENAGAIGKVFPRGNHWAVGHLMGKKSLDSLSGSEDSSNMDNIPSSEEDKLLDRYVQPSKLVQDFIRILGGLENKRQSQTQRQGQEHVLSRMGVLKTTKWEETDRHRYLKQLTDLIRLAFNMKENSVIN